jgi:hypothetical protein
MSRTCWTDGKLIKIWKLLFTQREGKLPFGDLVLGETIILKRMSKKCDMRLWIGFTEIKIRSRGEPM